ncbi:MAG: HPr family phosphocarrier protein [Gammaproteobacteria bacterium]
MIKKQITIINKLGLHARAAAKLVSLASRYACSIELIKNGRSVNGKSIMGVMMLAANQGTELELVIEGEDETDACTALENLINDRFGEEA